MWVPRLILTALIAFTVFLADEAGFLKPLDDRIAEFRMSWAVRAPTGNVVLVDIDAKSLAAIGRWPWPRSIHAAAIDRLRELDAATIAIDIDFSSASTPEGDAALEAALVRAGGAVILAAFAQRATGAKTENQILLARPLPRFARASWLASVNVIPDHDGAVRGFRYGEILDGETLLSLPASLSFITGQVDDEFLIDFGIDATAIDRISVIDLLNGSVVKERIAGKQVILGAQAVELRDFFNVPVHRVVSGTMLEALATESLLQGRALRAPPQLVTILGLVLIFAFGATLLRWWHWARILPALALMAVVIEGGAVAAQTAIPVLPRTAAWLVALAAFGVVALVRAIDIQKILLMISRSQTRSAQTILDQVVSDNFAGVLVADENGSIRAASKAAGQILKLTVDMVGLTTADIPVGAIANAPAEAIRELRAGRWQAKGARETRYIQNGDERILEYVTTPSELEGGVSLEGRRLPSKYFACVTFSDVTAKRQDAAFIDRLARFDPLTGLANRNYLVDRADEALHHGHSHDCAILCFSLDRFQGINDTLGHVAGDQLLIAGAARAQEIAGRHDVVARLSGEEYAVLFRGERAADQARVFAKALLARVGEPFQIGPHRFLVGISAGIAVASADSASGLVLLARADTALSRSKRAGGNSCLFFEAEMMSGMATRQALEFDLWQALDRDQFELVYQPQVQLLDRKITGVEALLRWHHPERGMVSPAEFVPVAEAVGLIVPLGDWILNRACHDAAAWSQPIKLAVNVSPLQFAQGNVVQSVGRALTRSGLSPSRLDLEITESLFFEKNALIDSALEFLREMGVGFVLDDFGTGYSSLSYIQKFRSDKIKIDRSFVTGLPLNSDAVAIVTAIAAMAQSLGIRVNAEGIESEVQVQLLRLVGCQEGQGFLLGRPQSAASIATLLGGNTSLPAPQDATTGAPRSLAG